MPSKGRLVSSTIASAVIKPWWAAESTASPNWPTLGNQPVLLFSRKMKKTRSVVVFISTEETAHVDVLFRLLFCWCLFLGSSCATTTTGGGSGTSLCRRLHGFELREAIARSNSSTGEVLEGVDDSVRNGRWDHVAGSKGDASEVVGTSTEARKDIIVGDLENLVAEELSVVHEGLDIHLILEGANLQTIEEGSLRGTNLVSLSDNSDGVDDFNLSSDNLGGDVEGLEELGLLWIHTGGTGGNSDILGGDSSNLSGSGSNLGIKNLLNGSKISVGENKTGVTDELISDDVEMRSWLPSSFSFLVVVVLSGIRLGDNISNGSLEMGVLSHDHLGTNFSHKLSHDTDLLGSDVIDLDEEAFVVFEQSFLEFVPTGGFHLLLCSLGHFVVVFILVLL